jgi:hypothetical protein
MAGRDCVAAHVASKHEDLSRQVLRRLAGLRVELTVAEAKALAQHLLDPLAVRIAADRRPRAKAKRFLHDVLRTGPIQATAVQRQARAFGISDKTLRRAGKTSASGSRRQGSGTAGRGRFPKVATDFPKMARDTAKMSMRRIGCR